MLFQPSNIAPSTLSGIGIGTVDVTLGLDVSWQVNGDSPMTDYQITLYQNDTASTQMYTTGKITLGTPFQPHDVKGNPMFFSTIISAATLSTAGIVNGYANGYKMLITQWWGAGADDYVEQSSASVFITRSTPTLSIDAIASPVTTSSLTITATYAQAEGDPISTVEWVFAIAGLEDNPIKETGAISTQVLSFNVDGLISGYTYSVMCNVVSSNGMEVSTGYVQFSVSYPYQQSMIDYTLAQMRNSSAVYLSWDGLANNVLEYPYEDSTKTTNGITFTVNGEGDMTANGTASADAYFALADGTLSDLGLSAGQKLLITSGYSGAQIEVTETNGSNVVVSTLRGNDPFQYIVPNTSNTLKISIVIANGKAVTSQAMKPMFYIEDKITAFNDVSVEIPPIQNLNGYSKPWAAGTGKNKIGYMRTRETYTVQFTYDVSDGSLKINGTATANAFEDLTSNYANYPLYPAGSYKVTGATGSNDYYMTVVVANTDGTARDDVIITSENTVITLASPAYLIPRYVVLSGKTANVTLYPMIRDASIADDTWEPYANICPISGSTGLSINRVGKNWLPSGTLSGDINITQNADGSYTMSGSTSSSARIAIPNFWDWTRTTSTQNDQKKHLPNGKYYINCGNSSLKLQVCASNNSGNTGLQVIFQDYVGTVTIDDTYQYNWVRLNIPPNVDPNLTFKPIICLYSEADKSFEPYNGNTYTSDWTSQAGTVYGGTVDIKSGTLTVDRVLVSKTWADGSNAAVYGDCTRKRFSYSDADDKAKKTDAICNTAVYIPEDTSTEWAKGSVFSIHNSSKLFYLSLPTSTPSTQAIQLCMHLDAPVTYQLTAQQIAALAETNNIWSDAGNVTLTYTKATGTTATITGKVVTISDSSAVSIPTPAYLPGITGVSIYRYAQGDSVLRHVYDFDSSVTEMLDYFAPSQTQVSYVIVGHGASDTFIRTSNFTPVFWFYSILLCSQDSSGKYHVRNEYAFKYGVETGAVSNNNAPQIQQNFTPYPTRQPTSSLYKTGSVKGYIGTVSSQKLYSDSVSLQNAIYAISTSTLTKFLKTRKGETIMVECAGPIQMQTGDSMVQQPLVATVDWVEMGDSSESSIVSIPSDGFWPL